MAYHSKYDGTKDTNRKRGRINPYLAEIRTQGYNISSSDFWKVVKRYQRFNEKIKKFGLQGINPFSATQTYFTSPSSSLEHTRTRSLGVISRRAIQFNVIENDLSAFRLKYGDYKLSEVMNISTVSQKKWVEFGMAEYYDPDFKFEDVTLNDAFNRFAKDSSYTKHHLFELIKKFKKGLKKSPRDLAVGS